MFMRCHLSHIFTFFSLMLAFSAVAFHFSSRNSAISVENFYEHYATFSTTQERALYVATPPEGSRQVAVVKGIPIIEAPNLSLTTADLDKIKQALNHAPAKFLETPPKAIIAATMKTRGAFAAPNTVATASGPYIFLGAGFFHGGFHHQNTPGERISIFMHEYAHVLQYYHLDKDEGTMLSLLRRSSLVFDFASRVGWKGNWLEGRWRQPDPEAHETTRYGATNPIEDLAESFGWVIAGHPEFVSEARAQYVLDYLGEEEDTFTQGVAPIHPAAKRAVGRPRGAVRYLIARAPQEFKDAGQESDQFYLFEKNAALTLEDVVAYYQRMLMARGFTETLPLQQKTLRDGAHYAEGIFIAKTDNKERRILVQLFDLRNTANDFTRGAVTMRMVVKDSIFSL